MNRIVMRLLIGLLVSLSTNFAMAEDSLSHLVKRIRPAVVTIVSYDHNRKVLAQGTGFLVDKRGVIVTNCHVVKGALYAEAITYAGKKHRIGVVLAENRLLDLIKVWGVEADNNVSWLPISKSPPAIGDRVAVLGSPMGLDQTVTEGIVSAIRSLPDLGTYFQISAPISPGSSGSPVVNMRGEVIGVATSQIVGGQNLNFAVAAKHILNLLLEENPRTIDDWIGTDDDSRILEFMNKAWSLVASGRKEFAIPWFQRVIQEVPCDGLAIVAWRMIGACYHEVGKTEEGIRFFEKATRTHSNCAEVHYMLGVCYGWADRYPDAMQSLKQTIRLDPRHARAHKHLGLIYAVYGNRNAAIQEYQVLKSIDSSMAEELFSFIYR